MRVQVGGGGAQAEAHLADAARDEVLVGDVAAADGAVDAFLHQADDAFAAADVQMDVRVSFREAVQGGDDEVDAGGGGHFHGDAALDDGAADGDRGFQVVDVLDDFAGALVVGQAFVGGVDFACAAVKQPDVEQPFQRLDLSGQGGACHAEGVGRAGEAAEFDDAAEGAHCLDAIQGHLCEYSFKQTEYRAFIRGK